MAPWAPIRRFTASSSAMRAPAARRAPRPPLRPSCRRCGPPGPPPTALRTPQDKLTAVGRAPVITRAASSKRRSKSARAPSLPKPPPASGSPCLTRLAALSSAAHSKAASITAAAPATPIAGAPRNGQRLHGIHDLAPVRGAHKSQIIWQKPLVHEPHHGPSLALLNPDRPRQVPQIKIHVISFILALSCMILLCYINRGRWCGRLFFGRSYHGFFARAIRVLLNSN